MIPQENTRYNEYEYPFKYATVSVGVSTASTYSVCYVITDPTPRPQPLHKTTTPEQGRHYNVINVLQWMPTELERRDVDLHAMGGELEGSLSAKRYYIIIPTDPNNIFIPTDPKSQHHAR